MATTYAPCRSCRQSCRWARSAKSGKSMPLNPDPDNARGNVLIDGHGRAFSFANAAAAIAFQEAKPDDELANSARYLSHHATCPHGHGWQGKTRADPDTPQGSLL